MKKYFATAAIPRRIILRRSALAAALAIALSLTLACASDGTSVPVTVTAADAWLPADGQATTQLTITSDGGRTPDLNPSLGRITGLRPTAAGVWSATFRAGKTTGRVIITSPGGEVRQTGELYLVPPPDPGAAPVCTRDTLASYTVILDRIAATADLTLTPADNIFHSGIKLYFYPGSLPAFDGNTATFFLVVEGSSVSADLFDVRLAVDSVSPGALRNPGATVDGEMFYDLGDFPPTFSAAALEGHDAVWGDTVEIAMGADQVVVAGRVTASSPCPRPDAGFRIRPFLTRKGPDGISLRWSTDRESPNFAAYGGPGCDRVAAGTVTRRRLYDDYDWSFPRRFTDWFHTVELSGLTDGNTYWYKTPAVAAPPGPEPFRFGAKLGQDFTFAVLGDTRTDHDAHGHMADLIAQSRPNFYISTGDLVQDSNRDDEWLTFFRLEAPIQKNAPFFPTPGNHDLQAFDLFFNRFFSNGHWHSFDWGNSHFIYLDSYMPVDPTSPQYQWLWSDLAATATRPEIKFTFVIMHNPIWTIFPYGYYFAGLPNLEPLFSYYGVDAVFSGHIHLYERSNVMGRIYICTSGGGAPLRDPPMDPALNPWYVRHDVVYHFLSVTVEDDHFTVHAINWDGVEFDQVTRYAQP